jgi:hypothetical protein
MRWQTWSRPEVGARGISRRRAREQNEQGLLDAVLARKVYLTGTSGTRFHPDKAPLSGFI